MSGLMISQYEQCSVFCLLISEIQRMCASQVQ